MNKQRSLILTRYTWDTHYYPYAFYRMVEKRRRKMQLFASNLMYFSDPIRSNNRQELNTRSVRTISKKTGVWFGTKQFFATAQYDWARTWEKIWQVIEEKIVINPFLAGCIHAFCTHHLTQSIFYTCRHDTGQPTNQLSKNQWDAK